MSPTEFVSWISISSARTFFMLHGSEENHHFQAEGIAKLRPVEGLLRWYLIWDHSFASMSHWRYKHSTGAWTYSHLQTTPHISSISAAKTATFMSHTFGIMWSNGSSLATKTSLASEKQKPGDHEKCHCVLHFSDAKVLCCTCPRFPASGSPPKPCRLWNIWSSRSMYVCVWGGYIICINVTH